MYKDFDYLIRNQIDRLSIVFQLYLTNFTDEVTDHMIVLVYIRDSSESSAKVLHHTSLFLIVKFLIVKNVVHMRQFLEC